MSIFYTLFVTLAGHKLVLGPGGRAPRSSRVLGNRLRSDEHPGARLRAIGWVRGAEPRKLRALGNLITSDEHNYTLFVTLAGNFFFVLLFCPSSRTRTV